MDALGINGQAGQQRAQQAFQTNPGYQFSIDQAIDQVARSGVAKGAATGNTLAGITDRAGQIANQEYGNYLTRLGGFVPQEASTVGAGAGALSGLYSTDALNRANILGNVTSGTANSNTSAANAQLQGSANFWSGLLNLGKAAAQGYAGA